MAGGSGLKGSTSVRFGGDDSGRFGIAIQGDAGVFSDALIHLLLVPDVGATLAVSADESGHDVGSIQLGLSRVIDVRGGMLSFSDSDSASLPVAPLVTTPRLDVRIAFSAEGQAVGAGASWDATTQQVKLSRKITGAVSYSTYKTTARAFTYTPKTEAIGLGVRTTYGTIAAYYRGTLVLYDVPPTNIERGIAMIELYRRYSYKVANLDGEFELPPNYPSQGTYPDASLEIIVPGSAKLERVHEIAFIDQTGLVRVDTPNVRILEPYVGSTTYAPTIACRVNTLDVSKYPPDIVAKANDFVKSKNLGCKGT